MAIGTPITDTKLIANAIQEAVKEEVTLAFDERKAVLIKELNDRLEKDKNRVIAGIVLQVMKLVNYETYRDNLVITVKSAPPAAE